MNEEMWKTERKLNKSDQLELLNLKIVNHVQFGCEFIIMLARG